MALWKKLQCFEVAQVLQRSKTNWKLISLAIAAQSGYFFTTVQNLKSLFVAKIKFDASEENSSRVELSG